MGPGNGELRRGAFPGTAGILPALLILGTAHEAGGTRQAGRLRSQGRQKEAFRPLAALPLSRLVRPGRMPVPTSGIDPKWGISPTKTPPPQNVPKSA